MGEQQYEDNFSAIAVVITTTTPTTRRQEINLGRSCSTTCEQHHTISKEHNNINTCSESADGADDCCTNQQATRFTVKQYQEESERVSKLNNFTEAQTIGSRTKKEH